MLELIPELSKDQIIVYMIFGSHLYGTDTENSDLDFKGVYVPTLNQILLGKFPETYHYQSKSGDGKNSSKDIDIEIFSLHKFIEMACLGETVSIDMLHAPGSVLLETSDIWRFIHDHRSDFYSKNLKAFVGYARRQAAKYGVKGSRLAEAKAFVESIQGNPSDRLDNCWNVMKLGEHVKMIDNDPNGFPQVQVCGKVFNSRTMTSHVTKIMQKYIDEYGERAKLAEKNEGIDWKAISHAMRAAYQMLSIFETGDLKYPLKEADLLKRIKAGTMDYLTEASPLLDNLMDSVECMSLVSDYPEKIDREVWNTFIIEALRSIYGI